MSPIIGWIILVVLIVVIIVAIIVYVQFLKPTSTPDPKFTAFTVSPSPVCLNIGMPRVTVNYTFDPDGWNNPATLCVRLEANGQLIHNTPVHQCLEDGTNGGLHFNVAEMFGSTPPTQISVVGSLVPSVAGSPFDTREVSIEVRNDCAQPGLV